MTFVRFATKLPAAILRDLWAFFLDPAQWANDTGDNDDA